MSASTPPTPPPPPAGYRAPYPFDYPKLWVNLATLVLLITLGPLLWRLTGFLHRQAPADAFRIGPEQLLVIMLSIVLVPPLTIVLHELLHGLTYRWLGYRISYGFYWRLGPYTAAFGQFQRREHTIVVALAPLVVLSGGMLPLLAVREALVITIAFLTILINTSGATGDLYLVWRLLRMPPGTLTYDIDARHMFVYEPE
jgi:hypothetical protein